MKKLFYLISICVLMRTEKSMNQFQTLTLIKDDRFFQRLDSSNVHIIVEMETDLVS